jgi:heptosyltransferase-3
VCDKANYMFELACLISGRNLGDAVIQSRSVRRLIESGFVRRVVVWSRPDAAAAFADCPQTDTVTSPFPLLHRRLPRVSELRAFWRAAGEIRKCRPSVSIDFAGDLRERLFSLAIASPKHIAINWAAGHPYRRALGLAAPAHRSFGYLIPADVISVYRAHQLFVDSLTGTRQLADSSTPSQGRRRPARVVGLHPFASMECRLWSDGAWLELARRLLADGRRVRVFGAPSNRERIEQIFEPVLEQIEVVTVGFHSFLAAVSGVDLMVGLDSLGVHAADRAGVPSVMLSGSSDPRMWAPPLSMSVGQSGGCGLYPCYNRPGCADRADRYSCIRSIRVDQVLDAMNRHCDRSEG